MAKNKFPVKYIDNNLIFNHDGECFAYYELVPYNYSFLSNDEKISIHVAFQQMIAQNREGKIHALALATESSIEKAQEKSKRYIKPSPLADFAKQLIDEQTDALVSMVGNTMIDYRYFIGFKLMLTDQLFNVKDVSKQAMIALKDFVGEVNQALAGDFLVMSHKEIERYQTAERLLSDKLRKRFHIRAVNKNDIGYIIEHIYGQTGVAYEDYTFDLPIIKRNDECIIKTYDILKLNKVLLEESLKNIHIVRENSECFSACMTISSVKEDLEFPSSEILYDQQEFFNFPVDTSINVEIIPNRQAIKTVRNKKKELNDLDNNAYEAGNEPADEVEENIVKADELERDLKKYKDAIHKVSYVVRVTALTKEELERRLNQVKDFYDDRNIELVRPRGDMLGLHGEFIPTSKRYMKDYVQFVQADFLAGLGFGATHMIGEDAGIYIGYSCDNLNRNVYLRPNLASQGVAGSITNALSVLITGTLGSGKSFFNNLLTYWSVLFGGKAVIIDPKSERGHWGEAFPELADHINIANFETSNKNKGMLDPFVILQNRKDASALALNILSFLTGITMHDSKKFIALQKACKAVEDMEQGGLLNVIDVLRVRGTAEDVELADHIEMIQEYDMASLLFSDGHSDKEISLDKPINILQIADLRMPDEHTPISEYTMTEMLSTAMLLIITEFCLHLCYMDKDTYKIVGIEEAWTMLKMSMGKSLLDRLVRTGRSLQTATYIVTQNVGDFNNSEMRNNIGYKFAFRATDEKEITDILTFFGLDPTDERSRSRIKNLENGQCLYCDILGHIGVIQIHPVFTRFLDGFNTTPTIYEDKGE